MHEGGEQVAARDAVAEGAMRAGGGDAALVANRLEDVRAELGLDLREDALALEGGRERLGGGGERGRA